MSNCANNTHAFTVSFIYINAAYIATSLCFWIGFLFAMFWGTSSLSKISQKHHTVSSYCSSLEDMGLCISNTEASEELKKEKHVQVTYGTQENSDTITYETFAKMEFRSKFLIVATTTIGLNLCCLHVEEFNSRDQSHQYEFLFIIEIVACLLFPLVGIFPTDGGFSRKDMFLGHFLWVEVWLPISISNIIHQIAALVYFFAFQIINNYYTYRLWYMKDKFFWLFFTVNGVSSVVFITFLGSQAAIRLIEIFSKFTPTKNSLHQALSVASFFLESMMVVLVTVAATLGTMKRNNNIPWFQ